MNRSTDLIDAARAEALFTSPLSATGQPSVAEVTDTIRRAERAHGGARGCATDIAGEYGTHPETAVPRMRWALQSVEAMYARRRGRNRSPLSRLPQHACSDRSHGVAHGVAA
jgi:hypothetical protein